MRHLVWLTVIVAIVVADACPASAAVTTYLTRNSWDTAVGGVPTYTPTWRVTFNTNQFLEDKPFRVNPVDCGPFSLVQIGPGTLRNQIEVNPFEFDDGVPLGANNNNKYASMFTNYGVTSVLMTFEKPVYAWGANLYSVDSEQLNLGLILDVGEVLETISPSRVNGFFGVVSSDPYTPIRSILFTSLNNILDPTAGPVGEGFGMDNVVGEATVPEPSSFLVWSSFCVIGGIVAYRSRRRRVI